MSVSSAQLALARAVGARCDRRAASLTSAAVNHEAVRMAERLAPAAPWATDEPVPDLTILWATAAGVRTRPRRMPDGKHNRYRAWSER
jgi:hypothetical protein